MTSSRNDLEQWILRARQVDSWPSAPAQARVWDAIERRAAFGPPPVSIGPVHVGGTISASKLMIVLAIVTSVSAPLVGGIAAARMLDGEDAAPASAPIVAHHEPESIAIEATAATVVHDDGPIEVFDEGPTDPDVEIVDEPEPVRTTRVMRRTGAPSGSLAIETRILRSARAELRAGDVDEATQRLAEHRERFPHGVLVDLRAALEIDASCRLGDTARATSLATEFERRYPSSPYRARANDCQPGGGGQP
jgi:hypothetical protein